MAQMRVDARVNRERILASARTLVAERGVEVTMRAVARGAGVASATLHRHFPTRRELLAAVFAEQVRECERAVDEGAADPDPSRGFAHALTRLIVINAANRGFAEAFLATPAERDRLSAHRRSLLARLGELARAARAAGALRSDFAQSDLLLVLLAGRGLSGVPADRRAHAAHRFAVLSLDAFRASPPVSG